MANDCSVIILSYNTKEITRKCLRYLKKAVDYAKMTADIKVETLVVENGSADGSQEMVKKEFPWVRLIVAKENTGFARGNNLGMKKSRGSYILLLNSDSFAQKETIVSAINYMKEHPFCDVLGCALTYEDGRFQPSAGYSPNLANVFHWMLGIDKIPIFRNLLMPFHPNNPDFFAREREVGWITGAFMFLKRKVFEETKGFDEKYFMYAEEVEWCKRITKKGFKIYFTPRFSVIHLKAASSKSDPLRPLAREVEGILYFFKKHHPRQLFFVRLSLILGAFMRMVTFFLLGKKEKSRTYWEIIRGKIWKKLP